MADVGSGDGDGRGDDALDRHESAGPGGTDAARVFWIGLARAFGGALFFSLPLLMTMELWWLGFYMDRLRLGLLLLFTLPILVGLSHFVGFKVTEYWTDDIIDAVVAMGVGFVASSVVLLLFNIVSRDMPLHEMAGKVMLLATPASFGAIIASGELGSPGHVEEGRKRQASYWGEIFLMLAGAIYFAANVAPTEEIVLIAYKVTLWHALAITVLTIALMHVFVYEVEFRGSPSAPPGTPWWSIFLRFTVVGYAVVLLASGYMLWTFGRFAEQALIHDMLLTVVLGFPAGLGASVARILL